MPFRWLLLICALAVGLSTCVDPQAPEFEYLEDFLFVEGEITDQAGETVVRISESTLSFGRYVTLPVEASPVTITSDDNEVTTLYRKEDGLYVAPDDFRGRSDVRYRLEFGLADGRVYQSAWERMPQAIPLDSLYFVFEQESIFDEANNEFKPAHRILADWRDPVDNANFYEWRYLVFRQAFFCISCFGGIYRNGNCLRDPNLPPDNRYDYQCETPCWNIFRGTDVNTFSDEYVNGNTVRAREMAVIPFDSYHPLLIEVQQYTVTAERYRFNRLLADLTQGSGGLNAPPPAAIIGNITNAQDSEEKVLGYFGAASRRDRRLYVDRSRTNGTPSGAYVPVYEPPPPPPASVPYAPCIESSTRTGMKPEGWP